MATSYSTNLALALPVTGELSGTWGTVVNSNITNMLDEALGYQAYTATGGADTITIPDGTTGVARSIYIQLNGTGGGSVAVPTAKTKMYFVFNNTASAITFKVTGQTGVSIPAAAKIALVSNGTDIITAENYFAALTLGAALPVASGGTGVTTSTGSGNNVLSTSPTLVTPLLGTPTSGVATNLTGLPLSTGVTGTLPIANGGTGTTSTTFANLTTNVTGILPVANGGTATATPGLVQGSNITITGTWPNQTIAAAAPGSGTVTSVAATVPSLLSVSGSPITSSGTLAFTYSGTALPVANGGTGQTTLAAANIAVVNVANTFTGTQTFSGTSSATAIVLNDAAEVATVSATAATGTINYDITTQSVLYYTSNASANWTVNFRGSSGTSLDTLMSTGQSMTVAFLVTQGSTAYYNSAVQVDGTTSGVTTRWLGGAPTAGNASGIDSYRYLIIKTGSATFTVLASNTQFKA